MKYKPIYPSSPDEDERIRRKWYSVSQAAALLGYNPQRFYNRILRNQVPIAILLGNTRDRYRIDPDYVATIQQQQQFTSEWYDISEVARRLKRSTYWVYGKILNCEKIEKLKIDGTHWRINNEQIDAIQQLVNTGMHINNALEEIEDG